MKRATEQWTVADLRERVGLISFPDYQREPNLWTRTEKQRLIDSMVRQFDIASLYLYQHDDGVIDCVDGRQRIGAIMSFLGINPNDEDNGFPYRILNEIEDEGQGANAFEECVNLTYREIAEADSPVGMQFVEQFESYPMSVVMLTESRAANEFNLQFTRLNLGTILNSGEKLNAMVGDLREECFSSNGIGAHPFLKALGIPTRRYASEQLAAQILAQVFGLALDGAYVRTRHFDLQRLLKQHTEMGDRERSLVNDVREILDVLDEAFDNAAALKSRAMAVSTVLLARELQIDSTEKARELAEFVQELQMRLLWQIGKGLDVDPEYRYLDNFQRHVTQASVEKPAVEARARVMKELFEMWHATGAVKGDEDWKKKNAGMVLAEVQESDIKVRRQRRR